MTHLLQPRLVNDPFGDPGLYLDFRDERRALLFDLGDITALAPRKLLRLSHVFVTHTHMDHFSGFDHLLRVVLGRKERIVLTGGPRFVDQVEHKLRAYTWNVVHRYAVPITIEAREVAPGGAGQGARFSSLKGFEREPLDFFQLDDDVLHNEATFRVRGRFVDHEMACIAFAIEEKARVNVGRDRLEALGVTAGPWLRALKAAVLAGAPDDLPIGVRWRDRDGEHAMSRPLRDLRHVVLDVRPGRRIGYVTDLRYSEPNIEALAGLLQGVDLLFIESVFLQEDQDHAARKNHLTAQQAGLIARRVGAGAVVPFHFSPRYEGRDAELVDQVRSAWAQAPDARAQRAA
jgi:ribonuclease Z